MERECQQCTTLPSLRAKIVQDCAFAEREVWYVPRKTFPDSDIPTVIFGGMIFPNGLFGFTLASSSTVVAAAAAEAVSLSACTCDV